MTWPMFIQRRFAIEAPRPMPVPPPDTVTDLDRLSGEVSTKTRGSLQRSYGRAQYWLVYFGIKYPLYVRYHSEYDEYDAQLDLAIPSIELRGFTDPLVPVTVDDAVLVVHKDSIMARAVPMAVLAAPWEDETGWHLRLKGYGSLMIQGPPWAPTDNVTVTETAENNDD